MTRLSFIDAQSMIAAVIRELPEEFNLRGFPGERFRPSVQSSYVNDYGFVTIYLQIKRDDRWLDHSKGSLAEIRRELVNL